MTADRLAESAARLVLGLIPGAGPFLAEAVRFARALSDDGDAAAARAALDARLGDLTRRLAALEAAGVGVVKITGGRAQVLAVAVRHANAHVVGYCEVDKTIQELGLTPQVYMEAVQELDHLGAVTSYANLNHASGYAGVSPTAATFVALVGQVVPGVVVERELGELLAVFRRAENDQWVPRADFEALGIPTPRAQHVLQYLEDEELAKLLGPGTSEQQLMFLNARLLPRGRRVLRGDEPLPSA